MTTVMDVVRNPSLVVPILGHRGFFHSMEDEKYLKFSYKGYMGRDLDLENPKGFNEKLQWLKLHDRNPLYTMLVDKYRVKDWVADRIGSQYVTETYAVWDCAEDIDISGLPERFVLKTNHDSGGVAICRDRAIFDLDAAKRKLAKHLKYNYYWGCREWPYKDVKPLVFAEEYLDPDPTTNDLVDYKVMCFGGKARCVFTCTGRDADDLRVDFYDLDWNHMPFTRHYPNADVPAPRPAELEKMVELSERLSAEIPFVRSDFYEVGNDLYFGELTFYPGSGFEDFSSESWDEEFGKLIQLPGGGLFLVNELSTLWLHEAPAKRGIAEQVDYKFYCFDGAPKFIYVSQGLECHETARISFLTMDWENAPFGRSDYVPFEEIPPKPDTLGEMTLLAKRLSMGLPFVRADFFEYRGRSRFSEMTFHPCGGFMPFEPPEWDAKIGEMLALSR